MSTPISLDLHLERGGFRLNAELELPARGITGISGASGAGKTTLLRCVAGLERAERGRLSVGGTVWQDTARGIFLPPHRRAVAMVFQQAGLFPHLSVRGNLEYGMRRKRRFGHPVDFQAVVDMLDIGPLLARRPGFLSGGEQQRVAIGRALLSAPQLLLMDEPLANLDRGRKAEILPFLDTLQRTLAVPILYVSHSLEEIARLADNLVLMDAGRTLAAGPLATMLTRLDLPPAADPQAETILDGVIAEHQPDFRLALVDTRAGRFAVAADATPGQPARLRIHARDVSLCLDRPQRTSILNILPAQVVGMVDYGAGQVTVRLDCNGAPLLSRITRKSRHELQLRAGARVYAQIKAVALVDGV